MDKQYAQNLQDLTVKTGRIPQPIDTYSIASIKFKSKFIFSKTCRELFMQWSYKATTIDSNGNHFQQNILDDLVKDLLEQNNNSKKFLDDQQVFYEIEHRKVNI